MLYLPMQSEYCLCLSFSLPSTWRVCRDTCKWKCQNLHRLCLVFEIGSSGWRVCDQWVRCFSLLLVNPAQMLFSWTWVDKEALQTRSALALLRRAADESLAVAPGRRWHYGDVIPVNHLLINTTPFLSFLCLILGHCW